MSGTIGVGTPATTTTRGVGRLATTADLAEGATVNHDPALISVNALKSISTQYAACVTGLGSQRSYKEQACIQSCFSRA